jgi:hypothetical protein
MKATTKSDVTKAVRKKDIGRYSQLHKISY